MNTAQNRTEQKLKQRQHRIRQKARKREAHLKKLAELGKAVKDEAKLDPERWLPKSQRSYSKRGKKKNQFSGAQGVGGGAAKDSLKLDAKARADAKAKGESVEGSRSTAHLEVAAGGKQSRRGGKRTL